MFFVLAYFGGVLTILSPCILPVLPFVFARSDQPFRRAGLPLLIGMTATFVALASVATIAGGWAVRANAIGRFAALIVFALFGVALIFPSLADRLTRPLVGLGNRFSSSTGTGNGTVNSLLLGVGTGLLWAPCAGPILGLILTGAALEGASAHTTLLLLAYAAGAGTSLAVALLAGGRVFGALKRSLSAEEWIRKGLGVAVLVAVAAVAFGLDRGVLSRVSLASTGGIEQNLLDRLHANSSPAVAAAGRLETVSAGSGSQMPMPALTGATAWINSQPLTAASLKGKVVLIDFWTYSCINCLRTLPYLKAWDAEYKDKGLVIIGIHTPEFPFEKEEANVRKAVKDLGLTYPVAMDNDYALWRAFHNEYWPAHYFVDAKGIIRYQHFGEGGYAESEGWIRKLIAENNAGPLPAETIAVPAEGVETASITKDVQSPETYVGYQRAQNFASPGGLNHDDPERYTIPSTLSLNQWALSGKWRDEGQVATALSANDGLSFRFHARDLHFVLGPPDDGGVVHFKVTLDGKPPGPDHGVDVDAEGNGTVSGHRLYQLIRHQKGVEDQTFRIQFVQPGVQAYAFTFG